MRILITGGAGYVGSILTEYLLSQGNEVTVLDNLMYGQSSLLPICGNKNFSFILGDARNVELLKRVVPNADLIIPLAALVGAPACDREPQLAHSVNYEAVVQLNTIRTPNQKIIFLTTNSGYGTKKSAEMCTEETPLTPISLYGRTKADAEKKLLESPNVITLRLATVFGVSPRMRLDLLVNDFVFRAMRDRYLVVFEKGFLRNYVHVQDVARCVQHCIMNFESMRNQIYNCGNDEANLSKEGLCNSIKMFIPDLFLDWSPVGEDPDKRNYVVSSAKLYNTGFKCAFSIENGIKELIKAYPFIPNIMRNA